MLLQGNLFIASFSNKTLIVFVTHAENRGISSGPQWTVRYALWMARRMWGTDGFGWFRNHQRPKACSCYRWRPSLEDRNDVKLMYPCNSCQRRKMRKVRNDSLFCKGYVFQIVCFYILIALSIGDMIPTFRSIFFQIGGKTHQLWFTWDVSPVLLDPLFCKSVYTSEIGHFTAVTQVIWIKGFSNSGMM